MGRLHLEFDFAWEHFNQLRVLVQYLSLKMVLIIFFSYFLGVETVDFTTWKAPNFWSVFIILFKLAFKWLVFFFFFWYYLAKCNKSHQYVVLMLSLPPFYSETPSWMPVGADFQVTACDSYIKNFITAKHLSFSTSDFSFLVHYPLNKFTYFKLFFFLSYQYRGFRG